ncbi:MAG: hypothetical protein KF684_08235 [Phycisphaeraceae bacterium]|nr:hypothetical protein [Phycisphaeraceae bacterium]
MHFDMIDHVAEQTEGRIVVHKTVSNAEEYLLDHFPGFPVLPGVLMLETMVQAARRLLAAKDPALSRHVLGLARNVKYGALVRPGETLRVEVVIADFTPGEDGSIDCRATATVLRPGGAPEEPARGQVSGRFSMRPVSP